MKDLFEKQALPIALKKYRIYLDNREKLQNSDMRNNKNTIEQRVQELIKIIEILL
ncbi:MAG TPA: hypothetical protein VKU94_01150 [Geobacterales bacterium]|nr:hypothetical protein [Geobacterales bacterium]